MSNPQTDNYNKHVKPDLDDLMEKLKSLNMDYIIVVDVSDRPHNCRTALSRYVRKDAPPVMCGVCVLIDKIRETDSLVGNN